MEGNKNLTYEDLHEVLREVHADLKEEMDSGLHDAPSELAIAGQILLLKFIGARLRQRFEATNMASTEFNIALNKATTQK